MGTNSTFITLEELLQNNPFAVLATMHDPPPRPKHTANFYNVQLGKERIVLDGAAGAGAVDARDPGTTPLHTNSSTAFYAQCFNCHYRAHSAKQCPLRRCSTCGVFGHVTPPSMLSCRSPPGPQEASCAPARSAC